MNTYNKYHEFLPEIKQRVYDYKVKSIYKEPYPL